VSKKKEQLGKGLRALLTKIDSDDTPVEEKKAYVKELSKSIAEVDVNKIEPNPYQPRKEFVEAELLDLVQSIKTLGLIQPVTLRKTGEESYPLNWPGSKRSLLISELPMIRECWKWRWWKTFKEAISMP